METTNNPYRYSLATRLKEQAIFDLLKPQKGEEILDLGCGVGYFSTKISDMVSKCYGVDIDLKSISWARQNSPCSFIQGTAGRVPLKKESIDKVLFTDVIEHLEDDLTPLNEIARILKYQGEVVVTTASTEGVFAGSPLNRLFHDKSGTPEYHYRLGYETANLKQLLNDSGFEVTDIRYTTVFFGEIFMEALKLFYSLLRKDFERQSDAFSASNTVLFKLYKTVVFPILYFISIAEVRLLSNILKGHIVIMKGKKVPR